MNDSTIISHLIISFIFLMIGSGVGSCQTRTEMENDLVKRGLGVITVKPENGRRVFRFNDQVIK